MHKLYIFTLGTVTAYIEETGTSLDEIIRGIQAHGGYSASLTTEQAHVEIWIPLHAIRSLRLERHYVAE